MLYSKHKIWRDTFGIGASWQDIPKRYNFDKELRRLRRSHPRIPYTLEIECSNYWGNHEREFIAYSLGILDDVQMEIHYADNMLGLFWREEFYSDPLSFKEALENYELLRDYLFETFKPCDDWEQLSFYDIDWKSYHSTPSRSLLKIQLVKPLNEEWENRIIPRMKNFFSKRPYKYLLSDSKLIGIKLLDSKGTVIKEYV